MPICRQCSHLKSDLVFIIDGSWSVGDENFRKAKDFMKALGRQDFDLIDLNKYFSKAI